ncbi:MAG: metallopeptidase family protein [Phycisphaerae bacterium]|nr:metallopeptidase family protein [Phycisphaerae bacterium]
MSEHLPNWERNRFDRLMDLVMSSLPPRLHALLDEAPLIVDDCPSAELLEELGMDPELDDLCGLYSGVPLTERRHDASGDLPETIHVFRRGIIDEAGGWEPGLDEDGQAFGGEDEVMRQIRITVLHEIGHHFGLSEEELAELGFE